jgi:hypothetical protein
MYELYSLRHGDAIIVGGGGVIGFTNVHGTEIEASVRSSVTAAAATAAAAAAAAAAAST